MRFNTFFLIFMIQIACSLSLNYKGEKFPVKYLDAETLVPTRLDLNLYLSSLKRTVNYFYLYPNHTNCNEAIGFYFMNSVLKRALRDIDTEKLLKWEQEMINHLIKIGTDVLSHYLYNNRKKGWDDIEYRVSLLFKEDSSQIYAIRDFNRDRMKTWLFSAEGGVNVFGESMDTAMLPKEKYVELVESMHQYYISIDESDECISMIAVNPEPIDVSKTRPCRIDDNCKRVLHSSPSVAYSLNHRLLNILLLRNVRRCYLQSDYEDELHLDMLCANMYREAVYIARRGFFARDIFLEHIALCSMLGYKEFNRRHWFNKAVSWIDEEGCMTEFRNFEINRTKIYIMRANQTDKRQRFRFRRSLRKLLGEKCHHHPMAILLIVLAHAIRHAVYYMRG